MTVQKVATWIAVTEESLEDAPLIRAGIEYMVADHPPLTVTQRITGWRWFTSSEGVTLGYRVGWRLLVWNKLHPYVPDGRG